MRHDGDVGASDARAAPPASATTNRRPEPISESTPGPVADAVHHETLFTELRDLATPGTAAALSLRLAVLAYVLSRPDSDGMPAAVVVNAASAVLALVTLVGHRLDRLPERWYAPAAVAVLVMMGCADALNVAALRQLEFGFLSALALVAAGAALTRPLHFALVVAPVSAAWAAAATHAARSAPAPVDWVTQVLIVVATGVVAAVLHVSRTRMLERLARLRAADALREQELARALAEAQAVRLKLDAKVAERTAALEQELARRRASEQEREKLGEQLRQAQKMEAIGRLAGGVAHDFNNLLTVLRSSLDVLARVDPSNEERLSALSDAVEATDRATELTRGLLAFGRKQTLARAPLDVSALVRGVVRLVQRLGRADIRIEVHDPNPGLHVTGDRTQLEQVLLNLAINACDAMPRGGLLRLSVDTADAALRDSSARETAPGEHVRIAVSDTGIGMDEATRNAIFEPFFTTKGPGRGTGLGLAVAHGIVTQHGGTIDVHSAPGRGTTFEVWLPRTRAPARLGDSGERVRSSMPPARRPRKETILVIEDEPGVRRATARILRSAGYEVIATASGIEALELSAKPTVEAVDLVLSDIVMPDLDGPATVARLREIWPEMRALFVSGYGEDVLCRTGGLREGDELLAKPFRPGQLLSAVAEALQRIEGRQARAEAPEGSRRSSPTA